MGIRINKVLGFGLTNVINNDPRFNYNLSILEKEYLYSKEKNKEFIENLASCISKDNIILKMEYNDYIKNNFDLRGVIAVGCSEYETDEDNEDVILFSPPTPLWFRHDDIIDYCEFGGVPKNKIQFLDAPIFPYIGYVNKDTQKTTFEKDGKVFPYLHLIQFLNGIPKDNNVFDDWNFKSNKEIREKVVPMIPEFIICLCKFLNIFKDEKTIYDLKPMIYTFWR